AYAVHRGTDRLHYRRRARLFVDRVLEISGAQSRFLEVTVGAGNRVAAEQLHGTALPGTGQPQLSPVIDDLIMTTAQGGGKDGIDLCDRHAFQGIVLVYENREGINGYRDSRWLIAILAFKSLDFVILHFPAHGTHIGGSLGQCRGCGGRACCLDLDVHVWVEALEFLCPQRHQVGERIGTHAGEVTGYPTGSLIFRNAGVELCCQNHAATGHAHHQGQWLDQGFDIHHDASKCVLRNQPRLVDRQWSHYKSVI